MSEGQNNKQGQAKPGVVFTVSDETTPRELLDKACKTLGRFADLDNPADWILIHTAIKLMDDPEATSSECQEMFEKVRFALNAYAPPFHKFLERDGKWGFWPSYGALVSGLTSGQVLEINVGPLSEFNLMMDAKPRFLYVHDESRGKLVVYSLTEVWRED